MHAWILPSKTLSKDSPTIVVPSIEFNTHCSFVIKTPSVTLSCDV